MILQSTLHVTNQSTTKLAKTVSDLTTVVANLTSLASNQEAVLSAIAEKEAELTELDVKLNETKRQKEVALEIALRENALAKVNEVLQAQGRTSIPLEELTKLKTDYTTLSKDFETKLNAEVGKVNGMATAKIATALKEKDLEQAAKSAQTEAKLTSLQDQLAAATNQINDYKAQIAADREARIKEAQARGNPVVTVASGK